MLDIQKCRLWGKKSFSAHHFEFLLEHKEGYISQVALRLDGPCAPEIWPMEYEQMTVTSGPLV